MLRKLSRNALLYDLHVAHPEFTYEMLAERIQYLAQVETAQPCPRICRERVRQLLENEAERRALQAKQPAITK